MKKRKSVLQFILTVCLLFTLFTWLGCEDILVPEPESFTSGENYYQSPAQFEAAINGAYNRLRTQAGISTAQFRAMAEQRFDAVHNDPEKPQNIPPHTPIDLWHVSPSNDWIHQQWNSLYHTIAQSNIILDRIEGVEFSDGTQRDQIIGQARFIRALSYWYLVQFFGEVPVYLHEVKTPEEAMPIGGRRPVEEVYAQIIDDLQDAIDKLPPSWSEPGYATEGAAKFLLGRTYLLTEDYDSALRELDEVVHSYDYELLPNYRDVFDPSNTNNSESIFELQFGANISGQPHMGIIDELIPWFARGLILPSSVAPVSTSLASFEFVERYEENDLREDASIFWFERASGETIPILGKYIYPEHINAQGQQEGNDILFRYADALLSLAEAHWRLENESEAISYVDQVRNRAGLAGVDLANVPESPMIAGTYLANDPLGRAIFNERTVELVFEGHRMFDLVRFGVALEVATAYTNSLLERYGSSLQGTLGTVEPHEILFPIHPREITASGGVLTQTPGW